MAPSDSEPGFSQAERWFVDTVRALSEGVERGAVREVGRGAAALT